MTELEVSRHGGPDTQRSSMVLEKPSVGRNDDGKLVDGAAPSLPVQLPLCDSDFDSFTSMCLSTAHGAAFVVSAARFAVHRQPSWRYPPCVPKQPSLALYSCFVTVYVLNSSIVAALVLEMCARTLRTVCASLLTHQSCSRQRSTAYAGLLPSWSQALATMSNRMHYIVDTAL